MSFETDPSEKPSARILPWPGARPGPEGRERTLLEHRAPQPIRTLDPAQIAHRRHMLGFLTSQVTGRGVMLAFRQRGE